MDPCPRLRGPSFIRLIALKDGREEGEAETGEQFPVGCDGGQKLHHVLHAELRGRGEKDG